MGGFEITFRGKTIHLAPECNTGIFVCQRNGSFHTSVSGLEEKSGENMMTHIWRDSEMELGETLEIEIKDINNPSEPIEKKVSFTNSTPITGKEYEDMLLEKLGVFRALEKHLKDEASPSLEIFPIF